MLLKEFLQEYMPLSKGSVKIPIKPIIDNYKSRYDKLIKEKSFSHDVYKTTSGRTIVHVKVPSETVERFYYDVLFELEPTFKAMSIEDCHVRFFSNCPSFVYTYAYVFYHLDPDGDQQKTKKTGLLIPNLTRKIPKDRLLMPGTEEKLPDEVLNKEPVLRNPRMLTIPDKSIYYAIFYLQSKEYHSVVTTKRIRTELQIFTSVEDFDTLMLKRKRQVERTKQTKRTKRIEEEKQVSKILKRSQSAVNTVKPLKPHSVKSAKRPMHASNVHKIGKK